MTASEFKEWLQDKKCALYMWNIEVDEKSMVAFTLGCYYDNSDGYFKVYKVGERNNLRVQLKTKDEHEAYNKLKDMVEFAISNSRGCI